MSFEDTCGMRGETFHERTIRKGLTPRTSVNDAPHRLWWLLFLSIPFNFGMHDCRRKIISTVLADMITKKFLGSFYFVIIFAVITKLIPPEDLLCNVAATGVSLVARKQAKEFAL